MRVYRKRPSGLAPADLRRAARVSPQRAAAAVGAVGAGIVCFALIGSDFGGMWALLGLAFMASTLFFAMYSGSLAIERPSIVLSSRPKWDGQVRTAWLVKSDDPVASATSIALALDEELGRSLVAVIADDGRPTGTPLRTALRQSEQPVLVGWSTVEDRPPSLDVGRDMEGIWLRVDVNDSGGTASLLASDGNATELLCRVAARA